MQAILLPTNDIVRTFNKLDPVFNFYEGGIKGVIKDTILVSEGYKLPECKAIDTGLTEKILHDYENSTEAKLIQYTQYPDNSLLIEIVTGLIEGMVNAMMHSVLSKMIYDVNHENWHWVGNDLKVVVNILD